MPVVLLATLTVVAVLLVVVLRRPRSSAAPLPPVLAVAERSTRRWRTAGLAVGLVASGAVASSGGLGRGVLLATPVLGLCVLAGVVVGELKVNAPVGPVRTAAVEVRRVRDVLPTALTGWVAAATVLLAATLVATTLRGSADDVGRAGRRLYRLCTATSAEGAGPWPGSYYSLPLAAVLLLGGLAAALTLQRVVRRPRPGADPAADDAVRRRSADVVVAALGLLVAVPFAGVSAVAGAAALGISCRPLWWSALAWALVAAAPVLLGLAAWCAAVLLAPQRPTAPRARVATGRTGVR